MEKKEVALIMKLLRVAYPQSFKAYSKDETHLLLEVWYRAFRDDDADLVTEAVRQLINYDAREFAPNIGQVRQRMIQIAIPTSPDDAEKAWNEMKRVLRMLPSERPDECKEYYENLPEKVKRIYSVHDLVEMAFFRRSNDLTQFEKPRFMRMYSELESHNIDKFMISGTSSLRIPKKDNLQIERRKSND